jgi:hypothetical protein
MPRQVPAAATGRLVFQLKAHGQEEGEHALEKRLPIAKQLTVGRFVLKIDSDGAVFTGPVGCSSHGHPQVRWSMQLVTKDEGYAAQFQEDRDGVWVLPRNSVECGNFSVPLCAAPH